MIEVTRLSGSTVVLNADLIEKVEATPDTVVTLTTGACFVVTESVPEVVASVIDYKARIFNPKLGSSDNRSLMVLQGSEMEKTWTLQPR
ncbi:flagellar FlbD family protein [Ferrimicrobium acidiphilum]|jgi:flagellar protein FlbD|uniref:Flagellar protein (FlbD) n=1 Tax=Ferrimicrobium acidiphilum DSM 19497 TaxID=1121877 RepID=A0A0D8FTX6_9ACTN|nr:flagellar FlbD family protein [Ferrimicrobium acidiphilum]KJE76591.1 flagellar protein (FlbD) [Ferrimicrobium acidiphilum DSM 19497]MCL5053927.1 flagellar FlbD family protein [Gammaproteobacteria bacterium]